MLLSRKKTQGEEQNWCVILSPIQNEIDKKKVSQKLTAVFSLTSEEAFDLVANTPIILLDNLTRPIASKLKDYFRAVGAEIVLTNDVFQKRKCYRTVWPEQPSLSFLHDWSPMKNAEHHEELPPAEALDEIRTMALEEENNLPKPSLASMPLLSRQEKENFQDDKDRLRKENNNLRDELRQIKEQLERLQKEKLLGLEQEEEDWIEEKEGDTKEIRLLLEHANEKYEALREEYANARHLYEEKISSFSQESELLKRKAHEAAEALKGLQRDRQAIDAQILQKDKDIQMVSEEGRRLRLSYEQKLAKSAESVSLIQLANKEMAEKIEFYQKNKEELEMTVNTQAEQIAYWHERHDSIAPKLIMAERKIDEEKNLREKNEVRQKDFEKSHMRLIQELEEKTKQIRDWEMKCLALDKQAVELKEAYQNQEKVMQNTFRQMEARERELEAARRQLRDINSQLEQREASQKRAILSGQLVEKEAALKKLVKEQEKIESEIKEREEFIRSILTQQESVEKEIIEAKQAQRHLAEIAKRDQKPGKFKITREHQESETPQDQADQGYSDHD